MSIPNKALRNLGLTISLALGLSLPTITLQAAVATFEDLTPARAYGGPGGGFFENGQNMTVVSSGPGSFSGTDFVNQFSSGSATFNNVWNDPGDFWSGFAYSNTSDTTTAGFTNQYSAFPGGGAGGSDNYAIGYTASAQIDFASPTQILGAYFTNTTYAALSMLNGDPFAKQFGGVTGDDPDFFKLLINGLDDTGNIVGTVEYFLADYRFADNALDYVVDTWEYVALDSLGAVSALSFGFESSDVGGFGINTPTYFALDDLTPVPLPASLWLLISAVAALFAIGRRKSGQVRAQ